MKIYKYLIFDVDDTLLDFYPAFATAQRNIADKLGIEPSKEYLETDEKCGWKAWEESCLDKTEERDVQENYLIIQRIMIDQYIPFGGEEQKCSSFFM